MKMPALLTSVSMRPKRSRPRRRRGRQCRERRCRRRSPGPRDQPQHRWSRSNGSWRRRGSRWRGSLSPGCAPMPRDAPVMTTTFGSELGGSTTPKLLRGDRPMPTWFAPRRRSDDRHCIDRTRSAPGGLGRCCGGWRAIASIAARRAAYPRPALEVKCALTIDVNSRSRDWQLTAEFHAFHAASRVPRQLSERPCGASFGRSAAHSSSASSAGHIAFPQSVRRYSTLGGTCG